MRGETRERWLKLCEEAATEQDAEKLLELAQEINRLLDEKDARIRGKRVQLTSDTSSSEN